MNRSVKLRIGRLILRRPAPGGRERIGPAIRAELEKLIAERGLPGHLANAGRSVRSSEARFDGDATAGSERLGAEIARGLHGQWSGNGKGKK